MKGLHMGNQSPGSWVVRFGGNRQHTTAALGLSIVVLLIGIFSLLQRAYLPAIVLVAAAAGLLWGVLYARRQYRHLAWAEAQRLILYHLRKSPGDFELEGILRRTNMPRHALEDACRSVYQKYLMGFLSDRELSSREKAALAVLQKKLDIPPAAASEIEERCKQELHKLELDRRMADGIITREEAADLQWLRHALGLTDVEALTATKESVEDGYRALFRRFAADGRLTASEVEQLQDFAKATGLSPEEAAQISRQDALDLFRRGVSIVCQDGEVTDEELRTLKGLREVLGLTASDIRPLMDQVKRVRELSEIRAGNVPTVAVHDLLLRSTEICHFNGSCTFEYQTKTKAKRINGTLIVTDRRVIFKSPVRSFEFSPRKVINVRTWANAVQIELTTTKGQGAYFVKDAEQLAAILQVLVTRHNFAGAERLDSERRRHIPDNVKVAVWQRDGGKCVRCGGTEYLEFDHIIPFSRGGANTENNVQLLCRKCNLRKGDELV
ncbi:MAG: HNH endonuclease [Armatimonadetes bacterium]|nr:HNH endonuclease [Armatimonadota bacterium]